MPINAACLKLIQKMQNSVGVYRHSFRQRCSTKYQNKQNTEPVSAKAVRTNISYKPTQLTAEK